jgi:putative membrane protein
MKRTTVAFIAIASLAFGACNSNNNAKYTDRTTTSDTIRTASDSNASNSKISTTDTAMKTNTTTTANTSPDEFVKMAASGGMMEVQAGKLAEQKAKNPRVKNFGKMMVTDHSKANAELKSVCNSKKMAIPTEMMAEHKQHVDELKNKTGADFDNAYMEMMLKDHQEDVQAFKDASQGMTDNDIKAFAGKTLPTLQKHLDSARAINGSLPK